MYCNAHAVISTTNPLPHPTTFKTMLKSSECKNVLMQYNKCKVMATINSVRTKELVITKYFWK